MSLIVRKAVVPAAGRGTRMRPATLAIPKELIALADRPPLHLVLQEARAGGIDQVAIVTRPTKPLIRQYVERVAESDPELSGLRFTWVEQAEPTGLGDAIVACRDFVDCDPFALLLPDNVLLAPRYRLGSMLELAAEHDSDVVGVVEIDSSLSGEYGDSGRIECLPLAGNAVRVTRLLPKRPGRLRVASGERLLRACGRYVCKPELVDDLVRLRPAGATDYDEVEAYREAVEGRGLLGCILPQPVFDVGHPNGFLAACAWLDRRRREDEAGTATRTGS